MDVVSSSGGDWDRDQSLQDPSEGETIDVLMIAWVWIVATVFFCVRVRRDHQQQQEEETEESHEERQKRRRRRSAVRRAALKRCLIVKRVLSADSQGNLRLGDCDDDVVGTTTAASPSDSKVVGEGGGLCHGDQQEEGDVDFDEDDEESTCMICLEPFAVGDTVAWGDSALSCADATEKTEAFRGGGCGGAAEGRCCHVFHRECIADWLMRPDHDDCPACRSVMLHFGDDLLEGKDENEQEDDDYGAHREVEALNHNSSSNRGNATFVIIHGLVCRAVRRASHSLPGVSLSSSPSFSDGNRDTDSLSDDDLEVSDHGGSERDADLEERTPVVVGRTLWRQRRRVSANGGKGDDGGGRYRPAGRTSLPSSSSSLGRFFGRERRQSAPDLLRAVEQQQQQQQQRQQRRRRRSFSSARVHVGCDGAVMILRRSSLSASGGRAFDTNTRPIAPTPSSLEEGAAAGFVGLNLAGTGFVGKTKKR